MWETLYDALYGPSMWAIQMSERPAELLGLPGPSASFGYVVLVSSACWVTLGSGVGLLVWLVSKGLRRRAEVT